MIHSYVLDRNTYKKITCSAFKPLSPEATTSKSSVKVRICKHGPLINSNQIGLSVKPWRRGKTAKIPSKAISWLRWRHIVFGCLLALITCEYINFSFYLDFSRYIKIKYKLYLRYNRAIISRLKLGIGYLIYVS